MRNGNHCGAPGSLAGLSFSPADFVHASVPLGDDMKFIEDNLRIAEILLHPLEVGRAHVDRGLGDLFRMRMGRFHLSHKAFPRLGTLSFGRVNHLLVPQIGKHREVVVPLADAHFIRPHPDDLPLRRGVRRPHMQKEHPPEARVCFPQDLPGFLDRHLAQERQGKRFKFPGKCLLWPSHGGFTRYTCSRLWAEPCGST